MSDLTLPTHEQFEQLLANNPPRPPSPLAVWGPIIGLALLLVIAMFAGGIAAALLPWLGMAALFTAMLIRMRRAAALDSAVRRTQEQAMLRRYRDALRRAWRLLPHTTSQPNLHAKTVALISHCLDELHAYDAAIVGYDYLIERLPKEHPGAIQLRVQHALAALGAQRLTDADDTLRRLRGPVMAVPNTMVAAAYRLAELAQHTLTHHYTDGVALADDLLEQLRPLGVEAGYGHALLALCYHEDRSGQLSDDQRRGAAAQWWRRATTLLPASALVAKFPDLAVLANPPQAAHA